MQNNFFTPTIEQMALRTGRLARFAGATGNYWWSVLHHNFLVEAIVAEVLEGKDQPYREKMMLYGLVHDLHEGVTGDIITPEKSDDTRLRQTAIDRVIYDRLGVPGPGSRYKGLLKDCDVRAMEAEALVFDDPCWWALNDRDAARARANVGDMRRVRFLLEQYGSPTLTTMPTSRGVLEYIESVYVGAWAVRRYYGELEEAA